MNPTQPLRAVVLIIFAVVFTSTGIVFGWLCSPLSLRCVPHVPTYAFGALLFGIPVLIVELPLLLVVLKFAPKFGAKLLSARGIAITIILCAIAGAFVGPHIGKSAGP